ncbi:MAG: cyclic nucleotide-binding domain-containing protein [Rhodospirillaceae bacterium]|nr:cyclic nucleotide-binding domain-containing protein [Rhodospirillaceae bacterium]
MTQRAKKRPRPKAKAKRAKAAVRTQRIPALRGLKAGQLRRKKFKAGVVLFHEEDAADCTYVVVSGAVSLSRLSRGGEDRPFLTLRANEIVGEMALIADGKRSATATAREDTETVVIDRAEFLSHLSRLNPFVHRVLTALVTRLKTTTDAYMEF